VEPGDLTKIARQTAATTFNCISVDGHTSTNDTVLFFANGDGPPLRGKALDEFADQVTVICQRLSQEIVRDAEGASHMIAISVSGLRSNADARQVAHAVANSPLVKTAVFGADPNWGRIVSAAGYSGVPFAERDLSVWIGEFLVYEQGVPQPFDAKKVSGYLKENREVELRLQFRLGKSGETVYTSDLTYEYVKLNAEYTT
jgi:glutamate N-acetyltransferase/amino-acid N-acetyltransferase